MKIAANPKPETILTCEGCPPDKPCSHPGIFRCAEAPTTQVQRSRTRPGAMGWPQHTKAGPSPLNPDGGGQSIPEDTRMTWDLPCRARGGSWLSDVLPASRSVIRESSGVMGPAPSGSRRVGPALMCWGGREGGGGLRPPRPGWWCGDAGAHHGPPSKRLFVRVGAHHGPPSKRLFHRVAFQAKVTNNDTSAPRAW